MSKLVTQYYQSTTAAHAKLLERGQFGWAPGLYLPTSITTLELAHYEPKDERQNRYAVLPNPPPNVVFNHTPVQELHLENNEELLVIKAKRRPFIVLSQIPPTMANGSREHERSLVCAPLYSFQSRNSLDFKERIKTLEYPWWIYLPANQTLRLNEGFIRLDRIQVIAYCLIEPTQIALTDDAMFLVSEWLRYYLTGSIDPIFLEDRKQLMQALTSSSQP